jgi:hypothetical protein
MASSESGLRGTTRLPPFEARLFNQWAGSGEFTPTAILFPLMGKVKVLRLWQLSQNPKHGKDKVSKEAEQSLFACVPRSPTKVCRWVCDKYPFVVRIEFSDLVG